MPRTAIALAVIATLLLATWGGRTLYLGNLRDVALEQQHRYARLYRLEYERDSRVLRLAPPAGEAVTLKLPGIRRISLRRFVSGDGHDREDWMLAGSDGEVLNVPYATIDTSPMLDLLGEGATDIDKAQSLRLAAEFERGHSRDCLLWAAALQEGEEIGCAITP